MDIQDCHSSMTSLGTVQTLKKEVEVDIPLAQYRNISVLSRVLQFTTQTFIYITNTKI